MEQQRWGGPGAAASALPGHFRGGGVGVQVEGVGGGGGGGRGGGLGDGGGANGTRCAFQIAPFGK